MASPPHLLSTLLLVLFLDLLLLHPLVLLLVVLVVLLLTMVVVWLLPFFPRGGIDLKRAQRRWKRPDIPNIQRQTSKSLETHCGSPLTAQSLPPSLPPSCHRGLEPSRVIRRCRQDLVWLERMTWRLEWKEGGRGEGRGRYGGHRGGQSEIRARPAVHSLPDARLRPRTTSLASSGGALWAHRGGCWRQLWHWQRRR